MKKNNALILLLLLLLSCKEMKTEKLLILNVDDVGTSADTIEGVIDLYNNNSISSVSFLAFGEDFENSTAKLKKHNIPVGVHLALNHGTGVLSLEDVPSLHRPDGMLWDTVEDTMRNMVIEEAEKELEAQIKKLLNAGVKLTHLDSHMGLVFINPELFQIYISLAKKYHLAIALPNSYYYKNARNEMEKSNLKYSISYNGIYNIPEETIEKRTEAYKNTIENLSQGINYMFSHPMPDKKSVRENYDDHSIRMNDYKLFMSKEWKKMLKDNNVKLVQF